MNKIYLSVLCFIVSSLLLSPPEVLLAACSVSTTPVSFGSYNVLSPSPNDATGSVTVSCDQSAPPTVTISIGASPNSGGFDPRLMKLAAGSDMLFYNFYIDASRTQIWGDGSANTFTKSNKVHKGRPWVNSVYGRIPPGQDVSVGSYSDTLTVIINW
ncbi:MAG: spore coat protein U domain-containing protein [Nitrospirae bacterium]|nr:spore coat protein U domain-containing protein [Nitrospirota bacterium]